MGRLPIQTPQRKTRWSLFSPLYSKSLEVVSSGSMVMKCLRPRHLLSRCSAVFGPASFPGLCVHCCWSSSRYNWKKGRGWEEKPHTLKKQFPQSYMSHLSECSLVASASYTKRWEIVFVPYGLVLSLKCMKIMFLRKKGKKGNGHQPAVSATKWKMGPSQRAR